MLSNFQDINIKMQQFLENEIVNSSRSNLRNDLKNNKKKIVTQNKEKLILNIKKKEKNSLYIYFYKKIANIVSKVLKIPLERMNMQENISRYGVDSIIVTEIIRCISNILNFPIAPTVFFEAKNIEELVNILFKRYRKKIKLYFFKKNKINQELKEKVNQEPEKQEIKENNTDIKDWINKFKFIINTSSDSINTSSDSINTSSDSINTSSDSINTSSDSIGYEPIAIISMEGIFPNSPNLQILEKNLRNENDCISEIPLSRWDWKKIFGDPQKGNFTNVKYGGFAPDIDKFDPIFFGMSPREAELMDPQHRLFIQCVWKLIESAGYAPKSLSGKKIGIFIGINLQDYAHMVNKSRKMDSLHLTSLGHMFCPNRLSFYLDIHGPSQVIDTACSSSLVALHRAILSIQHEECEMSIAGGANLIISPDMHIMYNKIGMISKDGRCKTFSKYADGYGRSDGIGVILLKSLKLAEKDNDNILAVIRGSSENHGGMSTSLTAPNPKSQAQLIIEAHNKAKSDPRSIGYIECHGTGTKLGDPIEVNGLKMAFEELFKINNISKSNINFCGLGSIKSNIGHTETSAGIAGVIKTVLSLRNSYLYKSIHSEDINPMIELEESPFYILQKGCFWKPPILNDNKLLRRAGVSSFGAGGSNAHIVIEEYIKNTTKYNFKIIDSDVLIILSAKNIDRLNDIIIEFFYFVKKILEKKKIVNLVDIAYTLQVGREEMSTRLAIIVNSISQLYLKLEQIYFSIKNKEKLENIISCYYGNLKKEKNIFFIKNKNFISDSDINDCFNNKNYKQLALWWIKGIKINWLKIYDNKKHKLHRVSLPTYVFSKKSYWIENLDNKKNIDYYLKSHTLLKNSISNLGKYYFSAKLTGKEFFLIDHMVMNKKILPGVMYLEMVCSAIKKITIKNISNQSIIQLKNIVWAQSFFVNENCSKILHMKMNQETNDQISYQIYSEQEKNNINERIIHSQGIAITKNMPIINDIDNINIDNLLENFTKIQLDTNFLLGNICYQIFNDMGINYGPTHQCLEKIYFSPKNEKKPPQVLAKLKLLKNIKENYKYSKKFMFHPGLVDSGLQACIGFMAYFGYINFDKKTNKVILNNKNIVSLPFALEYFILLSKPSTSLWVWIRYSKNSLFNSNIQKLDIDFYDKQGKVCICMRGLSSRSLKTNNLSKDFTALVYKPIWVRKDIKIDIKKNKIKNLSNFSIWSNHFIILCDFNNNFQKNIDEEIKKNIPLSKYFYLCIQQESIQDIYTTVSLHIFRKIRNILKSKLQGNILLQIVFIENEKSMFLNGLSGLLQSVNRENTKFHGQLIGLRDYDVSNLYSSKYIASIIYSNSVNKIYENKIRYSSIGREVFSWKELNFTSDERSIFSPLKENGIYLITGGNGGLGLLIAKFITHKINKGVVILCGRSFLNNKIQENINNLSIKNIKIKYYCLDINKKIEVEEFIKNIINKYNFINGIIHCAGLLMDNFIYKKSSSEFIKVLEPKVNGTIHLDEATKILNLDFFVLFSSISGSLGNAGQSDYATANSFLDIFSDYRNKLTLQNKRYGRTISINWPLWSNGGMKMQESVKNMMLKTSGIVEMPDIQGLNILYKVITLNISRIMVIYGISNRIRNYLEDINKKNIDSLFQENKSSSEINSNNINYNELRNCICKMLSKYISKLMKFSLEDIENDAQLSDYGFDSITFSDLANRLNRKYQLELTPTTFFEYPTINALSKLLSVQYYDKFIFKFGLKQKFIDKSVKLDKKLDVSNSIEKKEKLLSIYNNKLKNSPYNLLDNKIAIIGISGCFPMSQDIDEFWKNLLSGKDCISEIPLSRWDWKAIYGDPKKEANKTNIKWGGFINNIDTFDASFFNISPREAELMDPQHRLLMQYVWKAIEDAGYSPGSLSGSKTALFIGTASSGYSQLIANSNFTIDSYSATGVIDSIGPNRMSYFLNLHGPSEPVETACSSSLVAIHRALSAILIGDCEQAVVGGINLIVSPETQISFSKAGMLCEDGRCKTFSNKANGYVRGEGVGMLFLKKLSLAEKDGDHIYGVICGSSENHGGRSSSLTAPNPKAQTEVIKNAYIRANINPQSISYIEAHGTGTELGDPIEVNALKSAFSDLNKINNSEKFIKNSYCGIGSVKTNIGHLELAAGIAGVIKVLLQMKYKTLVKSLHCDKINPYITLKNSPFYLLHNNCKWKKLRDINGKKIPRRAGISSFGFGGVNAHLVIEEYSIKKEVFKYKSNSMALIVLSAKTIESLKEYAISLIKFITINNEISIKNKIYDHDNICKILSHIVHKYISNILNINKKEINFDDQLSQIGLDCIYGAILLEKLSKKFSIDISFNILLNDHSIISFVNAILLNYPNLYSIINKKYKKTQILNFNNHFKKIRNDINLFELAYTLQVGRDPMDHRLALTAISFDEILIKLQAFIDDRINDFQGLYLGRIKENKRIFSIFINDKEIQEALEKWMKCGKLTKLLEIWVLGMKISWEKLYGESCLYPKKPKRISIPGYPFAKKSYWIKKIEKNKIYDSDYKIAKKINKLHPLVHENISTFKYCKFRTFLTGKEFFLLDYSINETKILPNIVYLEMVCAATAISKDNYYKSSDVIEFHNITWINPFVFNTEKYIEIQLNKNINNTIKFKIISYSTLNNLDSSELQIHSKGFISYNNYNKYNLSYVDINLILNESDIQKFNSDQCYNLFKKFKLIHSPTYRNVYELYVSKKQVLAKLILPKIMSITLKKYILHPSIIGSALQCIIGLYLDKLNLTSIEKNYKELLLSFVIEDIYIFNSCTKLMWVHIYYDSINLAQEDIKKLNIDLCNENGIIHIKIKGYISNKFNFEDKEYKINYNNKKINQKNINNSINSILDKSDKNTDKLLYEKTIEYFKKIFSSLLKYPIDELDPNENIHSYGINSISIMELNIILEKKFGTLSKTLFFEFNTLNSLSNYFISSYHSKLIKLFNIKNNIKKNNIKKNNIKIKTSSLNKNYSNVITTLKWKKSSILSLPLNNVTNKKNYDIHVIFFTNEIIFIPGAICLSLFSIIKKIDYYFFDCAIKIFEYIQQNLINKNGRILFQIVIQNFKSKICSNIIFPIKFLHSISGILKTAHIENSNFFGQIIEITNQKNKDNFIKEIIQENSLMPFDQNIRYLNGKRYVLYFNKISSKKNAFPLFWKNDGIYLITGGMGKLGLIFAKEIINSTNNVTLILIGRSKLDLLQKEKLNSLKIRGAKIKYYSIDVTDQKSILELIKSINLKKKHGLNGILHCAGIIKNNLISKKNISEFKEILLVRALGAINLDIASRGINLDFMVLFSSISGVLGKYKYCDYSTANFFVNMYSEYRNQLSSSGLIESQINPIGRTLSINFPLCNNDKINIDNYNKKLVYKDIKIKKLNTENILSIFYYAMYTNYNHIIVLQGKLPYLRKLLPLNKKTTQKKSTKKLSDKKTTQKKSTKKLSDKKTTQKKSTKKLSDKKTTQKKSTKKLSDKKTTQKKSTKKLSDKKTTQKKSTKKLSDKKTTQKKSTKKLSKLNN
ncbi:SDR family NAD(P)-dependent oxidoreductase [Candidatus Profftella armatura]